MGCSLFSDLRTTGPLPRTRCSHLSRYATFLHERPSQALPPAQGLRYRAVRDVRSRVTVHEGRTRGYTHGCFPLLADRREPRRANAISYTRRGQGWFPFGIELQDRNHPAFGLHPSLSARRCSLRDAAQEGRTPGWVTIFKHACFPLLADRREDLRRAGVSERDQLYKEGPGVVSALGSLKIETTPAPPCRGGERSRAQEGRKPC